MRAAAADQFVDRRLRREHAHGSAPLANEHDEQIVGLWRQMRTVWDRV
jgi:hypothetical protein